MFKNARNYAYNKNLIYTEDIAPSYFIECLIYNVPNDCFVGDEKDVFYKVICWLYKNKNNLELLKCQNEIQKLFGYNYGDVTYNTWNVNDAIKFINVISNVWDNWGQL